MLSTPLEDVHPTDSIVNVIKDDLEPRYLLDRLFQDYALSEDDVEEIKAQTTRYQRCCVLVDKLCARKNVDECLKKFVSSLGEAYSWLKVNADQEVRTYIGRVQAVQEADEPGRDIVPSPRDDFVFACSNFRNKLKNLRLYSYLSTILNRGEYKNFYLQANQLKTASYSPDIRCMAVYLQACKAMFCNEKNNVKRLCEEFRVLISQTTNPVKCEVELLSVQAWRFVRVGKCNKLEDTLCQARQLILSNPDRCSGKVAGWIYVDWAHMLSILLESANPKRATKLKQQALSILGKAIDHFAEDKTTDGPFGIGFAKVKYVSLLLQCGNKMQFALQNIRPKTLQKAEQYLQSVEDLEIGIPDVLGVFYNIARSDFHFRRGNIPRAIDYASMASEKTEKLNMEEEQTSARIRLEYLHSIEERRCILHQARLFSSSGGSGEDNVLSEWEIVRKRHFVVMTVVRFFRCVALITCVIVGMLVPIV